jgi:2'-5' RNA ligase
VSEAASPHPLAERYDALWSVSEPNVRRGLVTLDPWATRKPRDARRGITLLARPEPPVAERISALLDELRALEPAQYYHPAADLHLTVLSLHTATVRYQPYLAHVEAYRDAVAEAVEGAPPFAVAMTGVTLATGAVLAQGFPVDESLARIRARLRAALAARALGGALDQRYRLETAHMTIVRFVAPLRVPQRFVDALAAARRREFGTSVVRRLELVLGDWYQTSERAYTIADYDLG